MEIGLAVLARTLPQPLINYQHFYFVDSNILWYNSANNMKIIKIKTVAALVASLAMFAMTFFAMAQNQNSNNIFLDSDQDGLTNQEEKTLGTDPNKSDTDGDGYSDGAEVRSGYNPLKPAPGDQLLPAAAVSDQNQSGAAEPSTASGADASSTTSGTGQTDQSTSSLLDASSLSTSTIDDLSSDPNDPNLTNEMVGNLLKQTIDKAQNSTDATVSPTFSQDDLSQIVQSSLATANVQKPMPEISDSEIKILPPVDDKKLSADEIKAAQKKEIETYLSSLAFVFAQSSPFPLENPSNLSTSLNKESDNLLSAITSGDQKKIDDYAQKTRSGIDQIKNIEVPYVMKDLDKSALQLAIYTLDFKDDLALNPSDPAKSLAALSSLQTTGASVLQLQSDFQTILDQYGITGITIK
jgi:hypothetical protein